MHLVLLISPVVLVHFALQHAPADAAQTKQHGACRTDWPARKKALALVPLAMYASSSSCCTADTYKFFLQAITQQLPRACQHTLIDEMTQRHEVAWLGDCGWWASAQCRRTHAGTIVVLTRIVGCMRET